MWLCALWRCDCLYQRGHPKHWCPVWADRSKMPRCKGRNPLHASNTAHDPLLVLWQAHRYRKRVTPYVITAIGLSILCRTTLWKMYILSVLTLSRRLLEGALRDTDRSQAK